MNADLVWPLTIVGTAAVAVAITVVTDWLRHHRHRSEPAWWERDIRHRQVDSEIEQSKRTLR